MKILSVASECVPFVKTGGLADVVGALPGALAGEGVDMRVLLPGYPAAMQAVAKATVLREEQEFFGGPARLLEGRAEGLHLFVLDAPHLFARDGAPYLEAPGRDWPDNPERFAALSMMAALIAAQGAGAGKRRWKPDLVHGHDWQAGFAPYYLRHNPTPTILTIHNIAFHGLAPAERMAGLHLDPADMTPDGFEFWGRVSALKAGLVWADRITTVSPTYARELTRADFGHGLDGVIRARAGALSGILNGIDTALWNPATDPALTARYKLPRGKAKARAALRREFDLPETDGPLCAVVSRLSEQKGLDLLLAALPTLLAEGGQLVLLGSGDTALEAGFLQAAHDANVAVRIGYDEALAHRIMAGADALLVPSRFEPCGLTQLYALRYGTIPVVAHTGGLADTVIHASPMALSSGAATGLHVHPLTEDALRLAFLDLAALFRDRETWSRMQRNAMAQNVGWARSAAAYAALYRETVAAAPARLEASAAS